MRRMPTWKSSEFVDVDAATLSTTLVSGSEPVDAHRPTVPAENCAVSAGGGRRRRGRTYVDVVRKVEPGAGGPGGAPVGHLLDHPLEVCRAGAHTVLQLHNL